MILDVGCGANPKGDVNIDAFPEVWVQCRKQWTPKDVKNFVKADAEHLPFRNNVFNRVVCFHALEHFTAPLQVLKEMKRVANGGVYLRVPSPFTAGQCDAHVYTWCHQTLRNLLNRVFSQVEVGYTNRQQILGRHNRLNRWLPFLNTLLSKWGLRPELYAICKSE